MCRYKYICYLLSNLSTHLITARLLLLIRYILRRCYKAAFELRQRSWSRFCSGFKRDSWNLAISRQIWAVFHENYQKKTKDKTRKKFSFNQVTTHSKLLSQNYTKHYETKKCILNKFPYCLLIPSSSLLRYWARLKAQRWKVKECFDLIIQCDCAHFYEDLKKSAQYIIIGECSKYLIESNSKFEGDAYEEWKVTN